MELPVERLSADELQSMDAAMTVAALYEIAAELNALGRLGRDMRLHVTECRKEARRDKADVEKGNRVLDAQAQFDNAKDRAKTLRELKSTLQTILRSTA